MVKDLLLYTQSSQVTNPNSEKLALIQRQPLGSYSKASYVCFYRALWQVYETSR
jgi:hypothetical protein